MHENLTLAFLIHLFQQNLNSALSINPSCNHNFKLLRKTHTIQRYIKQTIFSSVNFQLSHTAQEINGIFPGRIAALSTKGAIIYFIADFYHRLAPIKKFPERSNLSFSHTQGSRDGTRVLMTAGNSHRKATRERATHGTLHWKRGLRHTRADPKQIGAMAPLTESI
jgi:hypothetical protein